MKTKHLPRTSGIYQIRNTVNGKVYVGSAVDLQKRAHHHKEELRAGIHANDKLQKAWRKYGEDAFVIEVLEAIADPSDLIGREQWWMNQKACVEGGYNICPRAGSNLGIKWTPESCDRSSHTRSKPLTGFITPEGTPLTILNLRDFCRERGLNKNVMWALAAGRVTSYKGWSHVNAKPKDRDHVKIHEGFIDPEGKPHPPITNLEQFCNERGLDASTMRRLSKGEKRMHHGWTHAAWKPRPRTRVYTGKTVEGFINPAGEPVTITNLHRFCRDNGLDESVMCKVRRGIQTIHKGWTHRDHPPGPRKLPDAATHVGFIDPDGNPVVIRDMTRFCRENNLSLTSMYRLKRGEYDSINGWTFRPPKE